MQINKVKIMKKTVGLFAIILCVGILLFWIEGGSNGVWESSGGGDISEVEGDQIAERVEARGQGDAEVGAALASVAELQARFADPRLTYRTEFRNIHPDVKYVGDSACVDCHASLCTSFHQHPMGRSAILAGSDDLERYGPEAMNPCQIGPYELGVRMEGGQMVHALSAVGGDGEKLPEMDMPVSIAIGSGTRGRSYLVFDGDAVWQSPVSWFSTAGRWDVSPGFDLGGATQRPTISNCLFCHIQDHTLVEGSINRYQMPLARTQLSIGCERCHGPGELHVRERVEGKGATVEEVVAGVQGEGAALGAVVGGRKEVKDTSIVNPKHLPGELQMSICAQCHLAGKARVVRQGRKESEFRPGMPMELFMNAYVAHPEAKFKNKAVGHFDQMLQSSCRLPDGGKLLCTTCHDPHQKFAPAEAERKYLQDCKSCHSERGCSATVEVRATQEDHCIRCHMPTNANTNIAHTSLTDHRILRDPSQSVAVSNELGEVSVLVPYFQSELLTEQERGRNLGIALSKFVEKMPATLPLKQRTVAMSRELLGESLREWKDDTDGWLALSSLEMGAGNGQGAINALQSAMRANPKDENVLSMLAFMAESTGRMELAFGALSDLVAFNPSSQDYRLKRMVMFMSAGDFYQAEAESRELLRMNPMQPTARLVLGICLYGAGDKKGGRKEVDTALSLATSAQQRAAIQGWFDRFIAWQAKSE